MTRPAIELSVEAGGWGDALEELIETAALAAISGSGRSIRDGAEISIVLTDDAGIRELNKTWRGFDKPTNVLSFPAVEPDRIARSPMLGDIVLAFETLMREAGEEGRPFAHHLTHLVVHGTLHLLGYDHETDDEAREMEALETSVLAKLGVPDPYAGLDDVNATKVAD